MSDIHKQRAAKVFGVNEAQVTEEQRAWVKTRSFSLTCRTIDNLSEDGFIHLLQSLREAEAMRAQKPMEVYQRGYGVRSGGDIVDVHVYTKHIHDTGDGTSHFFGNRQMEVELRLKGLGVTSEERDPKAVIKKAIEALQFALEQDWDG